MTNLTLADFIENRSRDIPGGGGEATFLFIRSKHGRFHSHKLWEISNFKDSQQ